MSRIIFGVRPIEEAVRANPRSVSVIYVADSTRSQDLERALAAAKDRRVAVETRSRQSVAELAGGAAAHQGVVAIVGEYEYSDLGAIFAAVAESNEPALLLLLDGVTDPHNLGALVRSAEVLGAHGVVIPDRNAAPVNAGAVKASAGATERMRIARVGNLLRTIDALREDRGVRVLGASADGGEPLASADLRGPTAFVVGSEGRGLREAVARRCTGLVGIPQRGAVASLNASVAGAILLYEAARQRAQGRGGAGDAGRPDSSPSGDLK